MGVHGRMEILGGFGMFTDVLRPAPSPPASNPGFPHNVPHNPKAPSPSRRRCLTTTALLPPKASYPPYKGGRRDPPGDLALARFSSSLHQLLHVKPPHSHGTVSPDTAVKGLDSSGCSSSILLTIHLGSPIPPRLSAVTVSASSPTGMDGNIKVPGIVMVPSSESVNLPVVSLAGAHL